MRRPARGWSSPPTTSLDLNGHTIAGNPQARVSPDKAGVVLRMSPGVRVHDSTGDGTETYRSSGIQLHHSGPPFIHVSYGNVIEGNDSSGNFAAGIEITGPDPGSSVVGEHGNTIRNNVVNDNFLDGIHLAEGTVLTPAGSNRWARNRLVTVNQPCVAAR